MASSEKTPTIFPRFRQLPAELRIKIWNNALPDPRTIHLIREPEHTKKTSRSSPKRCIPTLPCPRSVYNLLHACTESRHEMLSHYEILLDSKVPNDPFSPIHYFDPYQDGIFVDQIWPWVRGGTNKPSGVLKTRRLSIACNTWWAMWNVNSPLLFGKYGLLMFKDLEELHIVFRILGDRERYQVIRNIRPGRSDASERPSEIEFPNPRADIRAEPILQKFAAMKKANPEWNVPKLKLMAWAAAPYFPPT